VYCNTAGHLASAAALLFCAAAGVAPNKDKPSKAAQSVKKERSVEVFIMCSIMREKLAIVHEGLKSP